MKQILTLLIIILTFACKALGQDDRTEVKSIKTIKLICTNEILPPPMYILQHKKEQHSLDTSKLKSLSPKEINSIKLIKPTTAQRKYGEKGVNGVILIKVNKTTFDAIARKEE